MASKMKNPYHIMLLPAEGKMKRLTNAFNNPELAVAFGLTQANKVFPGQPVEIVVVHTMTNEAIVNLMSKEQGDV